MVVPFAKFTTLCCIFIQGRAYVVWLFHLSRRQRMRNSQQTVALRVHLNTLCALLGKIRLDD